LEYGDENDQLPAIQGTFELFYGNSVHSSMQLFVKFIIFILSLFAGVRLLVSDLSLHINIRLMFFLDVILAIARSPIYSMSFFTRWRMIRRFDSLIALLLLACSVSVAFLFAGDLRHRDMSVSWLLS
jgi:hypothetical protein